MKRALITGIAMTFAGSAALADNLQDTQPQAGAPVDEKLVEEPDTSDVDVRSTEMGTNAGEPASMISRGEEPEVETNVKPGITTPMGNEAGES